MKSKNIRRNDKSEQFSKNSNDYLPNKRLVLIKLDKRYNVENDTKIKKDKKFNILYNGRNSSLNSQECPSKNQIIKLKNKNNNISPIRKGYLNNAYKNKIFRTTCNSSARSILSSESNNNKNKIKNRNRNKKDIKNISLYTKPLTMSISHLKKNKNNHCFNTKLLTMSLNKSNSNERNKKLLYSNRISCIKINNSSQKKIRLINEYNNHSKKIGINLPSTKSSNSNSLKKSEHDSNNFYYVKSNNYNFNTQQFSESIEIPKQKLECFTHKRKDSENITTKRKTCNKIVKTFHIVINDCKKVEDFKIQENGENNTFKIIESYKNSKSEKNLFSQNNLKLNPKRNVIENKSQTNIFDNNYKNNFIINIKAISSPNSNRLKNNSVKSLKEDNIIKDDSILDNNTIIESTEKNFSEGLFKGIIINGKREINGVMTYNDGSKYDGQWKNDKKKGRGIFISSLYNNDDDDAFGIRYEGEFNNDNFEGRGICKYSNGDIYEGEWKKNKQYGWGVVKYNNGDRYEGEWEDGKFNGIGKYFLNNGERFEGKFKDSKYDGYGKYYFINGDILEGIFIYDNPIGECILYKLDGSVEVKRFI